MKSNFLYEDPKKVAWKILLYLIQIDNDGYQKNDFQRILSLLPKRALGR